MRDGYADKRIAGYAWLEQQQLDSDTDLHIGHIALATALDWIEFRELPGFRQPPRLSNW